MINKEIFLKEITRVLLLCGQQANRAQIEAIYEEIKNKYEDEDLLIACRDRRLYKEWAYRIHISALLDVLDEVLGDRIEKETKQIKEKKKKEIKELIKSEELPDAVKELLRKL